jgi:hypothetical protein
MSRSGYGADIDGEIAGGVVAIAIVILVIAIYLAVKAINLIVRVLAKYPHVKVLWWLLASAVVFTALSGATVRWPTLQGLCGMVAALSWIALLIACKVVEIRYDQLFLQGNVNTIHQVLHQPWWQMTP